MPAALLIDYAGVLTSPLGVVYDRFARAEGVTVAALETALASLARPIARFEEGGLPEDDMERLLGQRLADVAGCRVRLDGLLARFAGCFTRDDAIWSALVTERRSWRRVGLLTNSWLRQTYPSDAELAEVFDVVVMSREVGLRKPDRRIFALALEQLDVAPGDCLFIDDAPANVEAAKAAGLHARLFAGALDMRP